MPLGTRQFAKVSTFYPKKEYDSVSREKLGVQGNKN